MFAIVSLVLNTNTSKNPLQQGVHEVERVVATRKRGGLIVACQWRIYVQEGRVDQGFNEL